MNLTAPGGPVSLASGAEVMCDPGGNLSLQGARAGAYLPLATESPTSGDCLGYWLRFNLRADHLPPGGWVLQLSRDWSYAWLYTGDSGTIPAQRTGSAIPPQDRALPSGNVVLPLALERGREQLFYLHLVGDTSRFGEASAIGGKIQPLENWIQEQRSLLFGQGVYAGIIVGLLLYNLILFLAIQERVYLYYVLYVASFGSLWIARTGFFYQYLWPHHAWWDSQYQPFLAASAIIFSILFVRKFLATRQHSHHADRLLLGLAALTSLFCLARVGGIAMPLALPLALIGLAVTFVYAAMGLVALLRGFRPARFFLLAWTALLVGNFIYILMFLRFFPTTFLTYNSAQAGSALECILLAFALADRVNLVKRQKEEDQQQHTHELQVQVRQRTRELNDAVEQLKTASLTDPLTGLGNRRHVDAAIPPWIAELQRERVRNTPGTPSRYLAICLADLDNFKVINDDLGHAVGDKVLHAVADVLRQNVRATAILSRWGGEEFLVLDHVTAPHEDLLMAERLRRSILDDCPGVVVGSGHPMSLSLGVVRYPFSDSFPELLDWDHCLALADHALYRAKKAGRNRWRCYRANEDALRTAVQVHGPEEVRRLLRSHSEEAFASGMIEVVAEVVSDVTVS